MIIIFHGLSFLFLCVPLEGLQYQSLWQRLSSTIKLFIQLPGVNPIGADVSFWKALRLFFINMHKKMQILKIKNVLQ